MPEVSPDLMLQNKQASKTYDVTKVAKYDENVIPHWRKSCTLQ